MTPTPDLKAAALAATTLDIEQEKREFAIAFRHKWPTEMSDEEIPILCSITFDGWLVAKKSVAERLQVAEDTVKELHNIGAQMSHIMHRLSMRPGRVIDASNCAVMHYLQAQWAAARRRTP